MFELNSFLPKKPPLVHVSEIRTKWPRGGCHHNDSLQTGGPHARFFATDTKTCEFPLKIKYLHTKRHFLGYWITIKVSVAKNRAGDPQFLIYQYDGTHLEVIWYEFQKPVQEEFFWRQLFSSNNNTNLHFRGNYPFYLPLEGEQMRWNIIVHKPQSMCLTSVEFYENPHTILNFDPSERPQGPRSSLTMKHL